MGEGLKLLELRPAPHEVAVARVPAGMAVRVHLRLRDPLELTASPDIRFMQVPGHGRALGRRTWDNAEGIAQDRHLRDGSVWQQAAGMIGRSDGPSCLYVVHEQVQEHGKTLWAAVRIREEARCTEAAPGS